MRERGIVWAALALVACGSNATSDYNSFTASTIKLFCQHQVDCGFLDSTYEPACEQSLQHGGGHVDTSLLNFDSGRAAGCFDALKRALASDCHVTLNLSSMMLNDACKPVVTGKSPVGGTCPLLIECVPDAVCQLTLGSTKCSSVCQARQPLGAACTTSNCVTTTYCDGTKNVCVAQLDAGAICTGFPSTECKAPLVCQTSGTPPVKTCGTVVVAPDKQQGEACTFSDVCAPRLVCIGQSTNKGTCQPPLPKGAACTGDGCQSPYSCLNGICTPPPGLGEICDKGCLTGYCNPSSKKCEAFLPLGSACSTDAPGACASPNFCDPTTKICQLCQ